MRTKKNFATYLSQTLDELEAQGLRRFPVTLENAQGAHLFIKGRQYVNAGSNNVLGFAGRREILNAAQEMLEKHGLGSGASRLICGQFSVHLELEKKIAQFKGTEDSLVFPTGYMANLGTISALAGKGDIVIMDKLCHASIIDGARLSGALFRTYAHGNMNRLQRLLAKHFGKKIIVVTESVFSMDGDLAPLSDIVELCEKHNAFLMVDEAHAIGVLGKGGRGAIEMLGLTGKIDVTMGTLSKALGSQGGFIAGSRDLIAYLRNRSRAFIYTTALSPVAAAGALAAFSLLETEPELGGTALEKAFLVGSELRNMGYRCQCPAYSSDSRQALPAAHIVPVIVGSVENALQISRQIMEQGVFAPAIRPPTVPAGTARIRLSMMATHSEEDVAKIISAFKNAAR